MLIKDYFQEVESRIALLPEVVEYQVTKAGTARNPKSCILAESSKVKEGVPLTFHLSPLTFHLFQDDSVLHFIEFVDVKEPVEVYRYSYHYQDHDGSLIFRYDMAPHHKELKTFPHHKHLPDNEVITASEPNLTNVLDEIDDLACLKGNRL